MAGTPNAPVRADWCATIDVCLVVAWDEEMAIAIETASTIQVEPQVETQDAIKLVKLGKLLAQKPAVKTITGHQLTLTDNVFIPEFVKMNQGGTVDENGAYNPPVVGSDEKGSVYNLDCYSAVYNAAGEIVKYEKITYPRCQGEPIAINTEDNTFRAPQFVIMSMARKGEKPYTIAYVDELPTVQDTARLGEPGLITT